MTQCNEKIRIKVAWMNFSFTSQKQARVFQNLRTNTQKPCQTLHPQGIASHFCCYSKQKERKSTELTNIIFISQNQGLFQCLFTFEVCTSKFGFVVNLNWVLIKLFFELLNSNSSFSWRKWLAWFQIEVKCWIRIREIISFINSKLFVINFQLTFFTI